MGIIGSCTIYLENQILVHGMMWFQEFIPKGLVFKINGVACSKYHNHSRLKTIITGGTYMPI
jgi:hypothetical protein